MKGAVRLIAVNVAVFFVLAYLMQWSRFSLLHSVRASRSRRILVGSVYFFLVKPLRRRVTDDQVALYPRGEGAVASDDAHQCGRIEPRRDGIGNRAPWSRSSCSRPSTKCCEADTAAPRGARPAARQRRRLRRRRDGGGARGPARPGVLPARAVRLYSSCREASKRRRRTRSPVSRVCIGSERRGSDDRPARRLSGFTRRTPFDAAPRSDIADLRKAPARAQRQGCVRGNYLRRGARRSISSTLTA